MHTRPPSSVVGVMVLNSLTLVSQELLRIWAILCLTLSYLLDKAFLIYPRLIVCYKYLELSSWFCLFDVTSETFDGSDLLWRFRLVCILLVSSTWLHGLLKKSDAKEKMKFSLPTCRTVTSNSCKSPRSFDLIAKMRNLSLQQRQNFLQKISTRHLSFTIVASAVPFPITLKALPTIAEIKVQTKSNGQPKRSNNQFDDLSSLQHLQVSLKFKIFITTNPSSIERNRNVGSNKKKNKNNAIYPHDLPKLLRWTNWITYWDLKVVTGKVFINSVILEYSH